MPIGTSHNLFREIRPHYSPCILINIKEYKQVPLKTISGQILAQFIATEGCSLCTEK